MREARLEGVRRFDDRVDHYARSRPNYPQVIVSHLQTYGGLSVEARIVDVGAGTGKLSETFLRAGYTVIGVEPNGVMRRRARHLLAGERRLSIVAGRAEALPIAAASVDAIVAGQAFHWFDGARARREFQRALRSGGVVALVWNNRQDASSGFLDEYEAMLLRMCPEYAKIGNKHYEVEKLRHFFGNAPRYARFDHAQTLDHDGLVARLLSSSYVPASGSARDAVLTEARRLFECYARDGRVALAYDTELFHGTLAPA